MRPSVLVVVVCSVLLCACAAENGDDCEGHVLCTPENDNCIEEGTCTDDGFQIIRDIWANLIGDDKDESETGSEPMVRRRRSGDYGHGHFDDMSSNFGRFTRPTPDAGYDRYSGDMGGSYRGFYYRVPNPTYRKSFREGKWHLDNKHMIKNYYKRGTYELAKKYFIALPFVKIIPVTTTTSVDYIGRLQTYDGYDVHLCGKCYHGNPQIEFRSLGKPSRNVVRRFNFLPDTKRSRTEYGTTRIIQTGHARVSQAENDDGGYFKDHGSHHQGR